MYLSLLYQQYAGSFHKINVRRFLFRRLTVELAKQRWNVFKTAIRMSFEESVYLVQLLNPSQLLRAFVNLKATNRFIQLIFPG